MSTITLHPTRALKVIPSDFCDIPFPNVIVSSVVSAGGSFQIKDNSVDFIELGVSAGDIFYCYDAGFGATVVSVDSSHQITVNRDNTPGAGEDYLIFKGGQNRGCALYVPFTDNPLSIVTTSGDVANFVSAAAVMPIQVVKVNSTGTDLDDIIALW